eukprot:TRINITY_DN7915_c0_g1_i1.p1 TRINITY_DN7915_c0_g1~~TRINITY_DN7915_c0_g1_i1.p1  ORF type:complete len:347 (-),score=46.86 TRINITY_DN7915_c0_g1_i1:123-1163(-)
MDQTISKYRIVCESYNTQDLVSKNPPKIHNPNKKFLYKLSCPPNSLHSGQIVFSRWRSMPLPKCYSTSLPPTDYVLEQGEYIYPSQNVDSRGPIVTWHVNFADRELFLVYGGPLFAQDEHQVTEHPALGSLKEFLQKLRLSDSRFSPLTREDNRPTPILIQGVERRIKIDIKPNKILGIPKGLWGNEFMQANEETLKKASTPILNPTISNILAIEAPSKGSGEYSFGTINDILVTAYTGYVAVKVQSQLHVDPTGSVRAKVVVHTGGWGTGAYGGNKIIMVLLQLIAARLAGVDVMIYHGFTSEGCDAYREAMKVMGEITKEEITVSSLIAKIQGLGFKWGLSNGT